MTRLRKMMLDELERRNYSQNTRRLYLHAVSECAQYFHGSPDQLGLDQIRDYQVRLFRERKLKPNSVCAYVEALRFFFVHVLKRPWGNARSSVESSGSLVTHSTTPFSAWQLRAWAAPALPIL